MKKILFGLVVLLSFASCEQVSVDPIIKETLKLAADKSEITADGTDAATFTIKDSSDKSVEDATIYFAETNEPLEGNTFKTKYAGEYKFYAKRGDEQSNTITITAKADGDDDNGNNNGQEPEDKEIILSVAPATIEANGSDKVVFSLKVDGNEVDDFEVYNATGDTKLAGKEFSTTEAGTYSFYAMFEGEKS